MDNVFIERLWRPLKYERVFLNAFETGSEAQFGIGRWVGYCNAARPHSLFGCRTPDEVYGIEPMTEKMEDWRRKHQPDPPLPSCTARGFWDTGLKPTRRWAWFEAACVESRLA